MDNKTTVVIISMLAALLVAGGAFFYVKKTSEPEVVDFNIDLGYVKAVADLKLPGVLKDKKPILVDDLNDLNKWVEEEDYEYNKWAITTKGELEVKNGVLSRKSAGNSGLKLKDFEIVDGAVVVRARVTQKPETGAVGFRVHVRNGEEHWSHGYGLNTSSYSYELSAWHGKDKGKSATLAPTPAKAYLVPESSWMTVVVVIQGNKLSYYHDGELVAEVTDEGKSYAKGGVFLSLTHFVEIDKVLVYKF